MAWAPVHIYGVNTGQAAFVFTKGFSDRGSTPSEHFLGHTVADILQGYNNTSDEAPSLCTGELRGSIG